MSKSEKNFITIRQALGKRSGVPPGELSSTNAPMNVDQDMIVTFSPRQLRLLFLLHRYNAPMNYSLQTMQTASSADKLFSEFFHNIKAKVSQL